MSVKDAAIKSIQDLPESATWEEIEEKIHFLSAIDKGLEDIKQGRIVPHEDVKKSLAKWISK
jgi:predicted transcriptional regulator